MLNNIFSMLSRSMSPAVTSTAITAVEPKKNTNPFAPSDNNVFLANNSFKGSKSYGKNMPVSGGYFAGYYNEKPNIVGRKLFIEV